MSYLVTVCYKLQAIIREEKDSSKKLNYLMVYLVIYTQQNFEDIHWELPLKSTDIT
jgi:hypothetical protein